MEQAKAQKTRIDWKMPKLISLFLIGFTTALILFATIIQRISALSESQVTYWASDSETNNGFIQLLINNPNAIPGFTVITYNVPHNKVQLKENEAPTILTTTPSEAWAFGALIRDDGSPVLPPSVIPDDTLQKIDYTYTADTGLIVRMKNTHNVRIEMNLRSTKVAPKKNTTAQRIMA